MELNLSSDLNVVAVQEPTLIYQKKSSGLVLRYNNGSEYSVRANAAMVWSMTYDHIRNEIFWSSLYQGQGYGSPNPTDKYTLPIYHAKLGSNGLESTDKEKSKTSFKGF